MIKRLLEKFISWFKGLPWKLVLAGMLVLTLVLSFLVKGKLVFTDWIVAYVFAFITVVVVWKIAKKQ